MGAGKTTVAGEVAAALGVRALDSDRLLEDELGHSVAEEFRARGEASFRAAEEQLVCRLLEQADAGSVIALGGGSVLSERVRTALEPAPDGAARHRRAGRLASCWRQRGLWTREATAGVRSRGLRASCTPAA